MEPSLSHTLSPVSKDAVSFLGSLKDVLGERPQTYQENTQEKPVCFPAIERLLFLLKTSAPLSHSSSHHGRLRAERAIKE